MHKVFSFLVLSVFFLLAGCSSVESTLGLNKKAPDEFAVVKRAPLSLPPEYSLRPPMPGAARPQEQSTQEMAQQAVFGDESARHSQTSSAEDALLQEAGADMRQDNIRNIVDEDAFNNDDESVSEKLFGVDLSGGQNDETIDPAEEIKNIKDQGRS